MTDKNIILSLIGSRGTVFHDNPIYFTFVKIQLNILLEEYFSHIFSLGLSSDMLLLYSSNLGINDKYLKLILWS